MYCCTVFHNVHLSQVMCLFPQWWSPPILLQLLAAPLWTYYTCLYCLLTSYCENFWSYAAGPKSVCMPNIIHTKRCCLEQLHQSIFPHSTWSYLHPSLTIVLMCISSYTSYTYWPFLFSWEVIPFVVDMKTFLIHYLYILS